MPTARIEGEWGKRCPKCEYEHYPHLHPAVIVLVRDGNRCLLARKAIWAPGRYALVAGFVDNGESLEGCVRREVKVDPEELEDARWFPKGQLPSRPSHHSIAGFILKNYGE